MTPEQLQQIEQARRYADQDEYVVTRAHIRNLLAIIESQLVISRGVSLNGVPVEWLSLDASQA